MYIYKSDVILVGTKRFQLNPQDPDDFLVVITARLRDSVIEKSLFNQIETNSLLLAAQEIQLSKRWPDLDYILLNSFDDLVKNDFFTAQELLNGKSICDICLSDPKKIFEALNNFDKDEPVKLQNTIIYDLIKRDKFRQESFKEIDFFPKSRIINFDFNFATTI